MCRRKHAAAKDKEQVQKLDKQIKVASLLLTYCTELIA